MVKPEIGKYYKKRRKPANFLLVRDYALIKITKIKEITYHYNIIYIKYKDGDISRYAHHHSFDYLSYLDKHYTLEPYETMVEFCKKLKRSRCR